MNFVQLEAFVAVIRYRSFSKAAEAIYLSQPTISSHIRSLENELGVQLLIRSTKEIYPSATGRIFYNHATEILAQRDRALNEVRSYSTQVQGSLEIAASTVPSQYILPKVLSKLAKKHPDLFFSVKQYDSVHVIQKVINMDVEIGVTGTKFEKSTCVFEPFFQDRLAIITPNTELYQNMDSMISKNAILSSPFIAREPGSGTRKEYEDFLRDIGIDPKQMHTIAQMQGTESVKQAVKNGLGIAIISKVAAQDIIDSGEVLAFDYNSDKLDRSLYFVYLKNRHLSASAEAFMEETRKFVTATRF